VLDGIEQNGTDRLRRKQKMRTLMIAAATTLVLSVQMAPLAKADETTVIKKDAPATESKTVIKKEEAPATESKTVIKKKEGPVQDKKVIIHHDD
jgi:hypothetical protein